MTHTQLIEMIADEVSLDPSAEITADTDLLLGGLVDSLGVVRIVGWIEDELGIEIDPLDVVLDNFGTVDAMVAYIERRTT
jgi:acyl carrier protein